MTGGLKWSQLELISELGQGKAGSVWKARLRANVRGRHAGSLVAVKRFKRWVLDEASAIERIHREFEVGRRVAHPNVVQSVGVVADPDGLPALVMDYYDGQTLDSVLRADRLQQRERPLDWVASILSGLCHGLSALHRADIVHRDLKPANVILKDRVPIIMDLGVVAVPTADGLTETGQFLGTIRYAEPEYLFGEPETCATDCYSLGAIALELLGGVQFLAPQQHWAMLVAAKSNRKVSWPDFYGVAARYGIAFADFARFQCHRLLTGRTNRDVDLATLADRIERRFWERPYFIQTNRFEDWSLADHLSETLVEGLPTLQFPEDCDEHPPRRVPFHKAWLRIHTALKSDDIEVLRKLVREHYWAGWWGDWWEESHSTMKPFINAHAVVWRQRNDNFLFRLTEPVRLAHRLGYI